MPQLTLITLAALLSFSVALPTTSPLPPSQKPAYFLLAGDSTTANQSASGGGWGAGFLNTTLLHGASGHNYGHNGATTVSFREGGDWEAVLAEMESVREVWEAWVTIQFGHNDQKAASNISVAQYSDNLAQFVAAIHGAGGHPILVTPLSRRSYSGSPPRIIENLATQRNATIAVAKRTSTPLIDLNRASTDYLNAIGEENAWTYNLNLDDYTHLSDAGSVVFGNMVAWLIGEKIEELRQWTRADPAMVKDFKEGLYFYPRNATGAI